MSRAKKLLLVGLVLAAGLGLAWPFRKSADQDRMLEPTVVDGHVAPGRFPAQVSAPPDVTLPPGGTAVPVVDKMANTVEPPITPTDASPPSQDSVSFDLANHPALANSAAAAARELVSPDTPSTATSATPSGPKTPSSRPAYATGVASDSAADETYASRQIIHIVRSTDTLEKLAQRYLGDDGRTLEIFDLNRDQLENPHLLPIGAELKIPFMPGRAVD